MGVQLAPPLLDGTIPAFYSTDQGIEITIPFSMNRVVSLNQQVKGFQVKIKTVASSTALYEGYINKIEGQTNKVKVIIADDISKNKFKVGQYYKIQLAYVSGDFEDDNDQTVGYYSSVAIGKYTTMPVVTIENLQWPALNSHQYTYLGKYQSEDTTERVYSYKFNLYDSDEKLIATSGDLLHNTTNDDPEVLYTTDSYTFARDLPIGATYKVEYSVTTINNLTETSMKYNIAQKTSISPDLDAKVIVALNYNNGYVVVDLRANDTNKLATGSFIVARACEDSDYMQWDTVYKFSIIAQVPNLHLFNDFTVEQGKKYVYGIQQYNNSGLYSNRLLSEPIYVDFEDAFLFDGQQQLKIKYNPKVASFKKNLLEQKTDTIGGKYPFIFRNGRVCYNEFSISGLISYQMDEEHLFLLDSIDDFQINEFTTNLTGDNIAAERIFKMKVLEWLTNGEPKVFRSPTEGNFIIRLMNSSLSPNDVVGRMLHTFTSTAYEIADYNYATLGEMGFINIDNEITEKFQWETIELGTEAINLQNLKARTVRFDHMMPGQIVEITLENESQPQKIQIGVTGSYYIDLGVPITSIQVDAVTASYGGSITYSYLYAMEPAFENISNVEMIEVPQHQFIGEHDILTELLCVYNSEALNEDGSLGAWIKNPKVELNEIYRIDIEKRFLQKETIEIEKNDDNEDIDEKLATLKTGLHNPFILYELGIWTPGLGNSPTRPTGSFTSLEYYDGYNTISYKNDDAIYEPYVLIDESLISVNETEHAEFIRPGQLTKLQCGNGTVVNIGYQMAIIEHTIEHEAFTNRNVNKHPLQPLGVSIANYKRALKTLDNRVYGGKTIGFRNVTNRHYCKIDNYTGTLRNAGYELMEITFHKDMTIKAGNELWIEADTTTRTQSWDARILHTTGQATLDEDFVIKKGTHLWLKRNSELYEDKYTQWNIVEYSTVSPQERSAWRQSFNKARESVNDTYIEYIIELDKALKERARQKGEVV